MTSPVIRNALQFLTISLIVAFIGYFADAPRHLFSDPDEAQIKLSFMHVGTRIAECHRRTAEELAALPRHMRAPLECQRERVPVVVEITLDGEILFNSSLPATGLHSDGAARVHSVFPVPAGEHTILVKIRDTRREEGFDHQRETRAILAAGQNFVIDFVAAEGGIVFR